MSEGGGGVKESRRGRRTGPRKQPAPDSQATLVENRRGRRIDFWLPCDTVTTEPSTPAAWHRLLELGRADGGDPHGIAAELVALLNKRGEPEVVDWALPLLAGDNTEWVSLAAWVLRQHGYEQGRPFADLVNPALVARARSETGDGVRAALVTAMGFSGRPELAAELIRYADDECTEVRLAVAAHLPMMFDGEDPDDAAIAVLINLSEDADPHVRDWATMGLASQIERDSPEIRRALRARLTDDEASDDGAAIDGEAALGLAIRGDRSIVKLLQEWLGADPLTVGNLTVEAAGRLGNPALLPQLLVLRDAGWALDPSEPRGSTLDVAIDALQRI